MRSPTRLLGAVTILALALTACSPSASKTRSTTGGPGTPTTSMSARSLNRAVPQGYEAIPRAHLTSYLAALRRVDPALAANDVEAWRQGIFICYQIYAGGSSSSVTTFAAQAYRHAGATTSDAAAIVAAAKANLCKVPALKKQWQKHTSPVSPSR